MVFCVGDQVLPIYRVDLCSDSELLYWSGDFSPGDVGIIIELEEKSRWFDGVTVYARVLSSGGASGWCSSRFLIDVRHSPRYEAQQ